MNSLNQVPSWTVYFLSQCNVISTRSKDPNTKLGAVIVDEDNSVLSQGYNSLPRHVRDLASEVPERFERPEKYAWMEHAERNAIYNAARKGIRLEGSKMYVQILPCMDCARGIIQAGITQVIVDQAKVTAYQSDRYNSVESKKVRQMLYEANVDLLFYYAEIAELKAA